MNSWQKQSRDTFKTLKTLTQFVNLPHKKLYIENNFSLKIPKSFANLIHKKKIDDPILKQFLVTEKEQDDFPLSPLEDEKHMPVAGLVHKYKNRVLLIASHHCFAHCRYCFRQNFSYTDNDAIANWLEIKLYLQKKKDINEVILSGGDPLSLSDNKLKTLIENIATIKHIKTLRIHSRNLSIVPARITENFTEILKNSRLNVVLVFHINHTQELSEGFVKNLEKLKHPNITLLNQSVLLKGVNDNADILIALSNQLFAIGILPYYLHLLDKVRGSKQFFLSETETFKIYKKMQENLSGYLLPKLVQDTGEKSKLIMQ